MSIQNIMIIILLLVILTFVLYSASSKKRKLRQRLLRLNDKFNQVRYVPIKARLKRVSEIAHKDRQYQKGYDVWKYRYNNEVLKHENEILDQINFIDKNLKKQKPDEITSLIQIVEEKIQLTKEKADSILNDIQQFISLETILNKKSHEYQMLFREAINIFELNRKSSGSSAQFIDKLIEEIEEDFKKFKSYMDNVNFPEAISNLKKISKKLKKLLKKINIASNIKLFSEEIIPEYLADVNVLSEKSAYENNRIDENFIKQQLSKVKDQLSAIKIRSKIDDFNETKKVIESTLEILDQLHKEIHEETHAKNLFESMLTTWKKQTKKFYSITNDLNPLINQLKMRITLSNEENGFILAYQDTLTKTKEYNNRINATLHKEENYKFIELLKFLKKGTKHILETLILVRKVYDILDKKENDDIRSERELSSLKITFSELMSDIISNKFVSKDEKIKKNMQYLQDQISMTQQLINKVPRNVKEIQEKIELCSKVAKNIASYFYSIQERYKIAEDLIMWMSKYRFQSGGEDLNSLLEQAEIKFNNFKLKELEDILNIAKQTSIIKQNMEK